MKGMKLWLGKKNEPLKITLANGQSFTPIPNQT
jgi:hypothetical protein